MVLRKNKKKEGRKEGREINLSRMNSWKIMEGRMEINLSRMNIWMNSHVSDMKGLNPELYQHQIHLNTDTKNR